MTFFTFFFSLAWLSLPLLSFLFSSPGFLPFVLVISTETFEMLLEYARSKVPILFFLWVFRGVPASPLLFPHGSLTLLVFSPLFPSEVYFSPGSSKFLSIALPLPRFRYLSPFDLLIPNQNISVFLFPPLNLIRVLLLFFLPLFWGVGGVGHLSRGGGGVWFLGGCG